MSIYKRALGQEFQQLHSMLQKRYNLMAEQPIFGEGVMTRIEGGPWFLWPILKLGIKRKLLFPERGENIPFTIKNAPYDDGRQIHWERKFFFQNSTRFFDALMSLDEKRGIIEDYLGEPALMYSDLVFEVQNGALNIRSARQRVVLGRFEIPLPKWFQGIAEVNESYNDQTEKFEIDVTVRNPLIGQVFHYKGEFTSEDLT
ncbi:DUF4166 domain-containing protein [Piscibacillus sp. B03]|uniref:DUF4166 domain-containing protein n=1 Tax=Piscibacillus sp. B03 TaxID=3457430 RepID=UPI003FCCF07C